MKLFEKIKEKAKQIYAKMLVYLNCIKNYVLSYKEQISETIKYFINLALFIIMYGLPYCLALFILSDKLKFGIPFNIGWIYVVGLIWYTIKEEIPRIIRNCFPPRETRI